MHDTWAIRSQAAGRRALNLRQAIRTAFPDAERIEILGPNEAGERRFLFFGWAPC